MEIVPIAEEHIEAFHQCLESVARERLYLAFLEAPSIELEVFASNQAAIALYKSAGFVIEGIKTRGRKLEGIYDDVVCMALLYE